MKACPVITITTDFGFGSPYVAEMKGAILSVNANVKLVDATHSIEPQNVLQAALFLRQFAHAFPQGSVHIAVVDPGVGTHRRILLVEAIGQYFVAPDNGILTFPLSKATSIRVIDKDAFWREKVTATFHGRDIMSPIAAHLCAGISPEQLSSEFSHDPIRLAISEPVATKNSNGDWLIQGQVMMIDDFGNVITNIHLGALPSQHPRVEFQSVCLPFGKTYGDVKLGRLLSLIGSSGWLELAVNCGNAAQELNAKIGDSVLVTAENSSR